MFGAWGCQLSVLVPNPLSNGNAGRRQGEGGFQTRPYRVTPDRYNAIAQAMDLGSFSTYGARYVRSKVLSTWCGPPLSSIS